MRTNENNQPKQRRRMKRKKNKQIENRDTNTRNDCRYASDAGNWVCVCMREWRRDWSQQKCKEITFGFACGHRRPVGCTLQKSGRSFCRRIWWMQIEFVWNFISRHRLLLPFRCLWENKLQWRCSLWNWYNHRTNDAIPWKIHCRICSTVQCSTQMTKITLPLHVGDLL